MASCCFRQSNFIAFVGSILDISIDGSMSIAADIMKIAMIHVWNELRNQNLESKILIQVHDELLLEVKEEEISGSLAVDGFISSIAGLFGCTPITSFSQNIGLVAMTKVVNRFTIGTGAIIMIIAGIFPPFAALLTTVPHAVLGGCTIMMFGMIVIAGLKMLGKCGYTTRNMNIAALSLSIGLGFTQATGMFDIFPEMIKSVFAQNCVAVVFIIAIILNLVLPKKDAE